jgi:hypothetical protein
LHADLCVLRNEGLLPERPRLYARAEAEFDEEFVQQVVAQVPRSHGLRISDAADRAAGREFFFKRQERRVEEGTPAVAQVQYQGFRINDGPVRQELGDLTRRIKSGESLFGAPRRLAGGFATPDVSRAARSSLLGTRMSFRGSPLPVFTA